MVEERRGAHDSVELIYGLARAAYLLTDHPLSSGRPRGQLGVGGRWRVQNAAVQDAAEDVEAWSRRLSR